MSGFAFIYQVGRKTADLYPLQQMLGVLRHRGPDGSDCISFESAALGHLHFWTTPEEAGERQPVRDDALYLALDGRIDNRREILRDLSQSADANCSDAALFLAAYREWGNDCFRRVYGPFAVLIYNSLNHRVIAARDPVGDRTLFYHYNESLLLVASEENAILQYPGVASELDSSRIAAYFAFQAPPESGSTFFKAIKELLPGHLITAANHKIEVRRYWEYVPRENHNRSDEDYADEFRFLLDNSVSACLRSRTTPTILMSGGLDSTTVTALAVRHGAVRTVSWVFDELKACDERDYIRVMCEKFSLEAATFSADEYWPLRNYEQWPVDPNAPGNNLFRHLKQRAYEMAASSGSSVLLTGACGDRLYSGWNYWLRDLIRQKYFIRAVSDIAWHVRFRGVRRMRRYASFGASTYLKLFGMSVASELPAWLTEDAKNNLPQQSRWPVADPTPVTATRDNCVLGLYTAHDVSSEVNFAARSDLDVRDPYRNRRLLEFVLSLPTDQLYRRGTFKIILRNAMKGILPETIRLRSQMTPLDPLYRLGMINEAERIRSLLYRQDRKWPQYIRPEWLAQQSSKQQDPKETLLKWLCICYDEWISRRAQQNFDGRC